MPANLKKYGGDGSTFTVPVTIASGATTSNELDIQSALFVAIQMPAAITGATFKVHASNVGGGTFAEVVDDAGAAISITATAAKNIGLQSAVMAKLSAFRFIKLVSASAEGATRSFNLICKR